MSSNPQIIVNGFVKSGIAVALDGRTEEETEEDTDVSEDSESEDVFGSLSETEDLGRGREDTSDEFDSESEDDDR